MKRVTTIVLFLLLINCNLIYSQGTHFICQNPQYYYPEARVLYKNIPNKLYIYYNSENGDAKIDYYIECKGAEISGALLYSIKNIYADNVSILIYNKKDSSLIEKFEYSVMILPSPKAQLGYLDKHDVSIEEIMKQNELICTYGDSYLYEYHKITDYSIKVIYEGSVIIDLLNNKIDDRFKNLIKALKPGSKIIFHKITADCPSCKLTQLPDVEYNIIEK